nr:hypothetical protein [Tanacetum cinerariifolium]
MGYGHLSTILKTESDEVIKSSAKNLVPISSEYEVTSDDESECDVPIKDESSLVFTTFLNSLFGCIDDFTSSNDELLSNEDVPMENFKSYSNSLFDDEDFNSEEIDPHYFNVESGRIESLSNQDTLLDSSPKFDYLEEFTSEIMPTSIVNEECIKREHEEYISLMEKFLFINSFSNLMENFHANMIVESLSPSPIPIEDSDSLREEIDIFTDMDDLMPPSIKSDDYDSERDIYIFEELIMGYIVENKMYKAFPLPGESSQWQYKFPLPVEGVPTARRMKIPLLAVCTTMMKKLPVPSNADPTDSRSGRTITATTEDMQKKKNDVKARTTLLLSLPDEHQLRFSKYKTTRELWAVILKTFGDNEATKKRKKNLLKQQYGNFKAEGTGTLEQTF